MMRASPTGPEACRNCRHFQNEPAMIEAALPGFNALSSAYAAVRADDGLCMRHARYLAAHALCGDYSAAVTATHPAVWSGATSTKQS